MNKDSFDSARQIRMRALFENTVRQGSHHLIADQKLRAVEERINRVTEKLKSHLDRHRPAWVAGENKRLVAEHKGKLKLTLSPKWIPQTETSPAALAKRAFDAVDYRVEQRLARMEGITNRMRLRAGLENKNRSPTNRMDM